MFLYQARIESMQGAWSYACVNFTGGKCLVTAGAQLCFLVQLQCTVGLFLCYRLVIILIRDRSNFGAEAEECKPEK